MNKSQKTSKPSAKVSKPPAKKTAVAPPKAAQKPTKTVTKSVSKKTAAKPVASKSTTKKKVLRQPEKTNKTVQGKVSPKKPQKIQAEIKAKPSKLKTAAKPVALKSTAKKKALTGLGKPNKTVKGKVPSKNPQKASGKVSNKVKTAAAKQEKPLLIGKALIAAKKPARKSTVKRVPLKPSKTKKETTSRSVPKKPLVSKSVEVSAGRKEVKKAKGMTVAAEAIKPAVIEKKGIIKTSKPERAKVTSTKTSGAVRTKRPSVRKSSKSASVEKEDTTVKKRSISAPVERKMAGEKSLPEAPKAVPKKRPLAAKAPLRIKEEVKGKAEIKPKEEARATLKTVRRTTKDEGPSTLISAGPPHPPGEKAISIPATLLQPEKKAGKASKLRIFLPEEELPPEEAPIVKAPSPKLPEEYGENELLLMEVDPSIVFVSWEIRPDDIAHKTDKLTLRVYDVTGLDFDGSNANRYVDVALCSRVNSKFIDIKMPGRDVVMEVGLLNPQGEFLAIKRSNRVSMPALQAFDEFGFTGPLPGPDTPIGY